MEEVNFTAYIPCEVQLSKTVVLRFTASTGVLRLRAGDSRAECIRLAPGNSIEASVRLPESLVSLSAVEDLELEIYTVKS